MGTNNMQEIVIVQHAIRRCDDPFLVDGLGEVDWGWEADIRLKDNE